MRHRHVLHITFFVLFPSLLFGKRDFKAVKSSLSPDSSALPASTSSGEFDAASTAQLDSQFLLQLAGPTAPTVQVPLTFAPAPGPSPTNISRRSLAEVNRDAPVYRIPTSDGVVSGKPVATQKLFAKPQNSDKVVEVKEASAKEKKGKVHSLQVINTQLQVLPNFSGSFLEFLLGIRISLPFIGSGFNICIDKYWGSFPKVGIVVPNPIAWLIPEFSDMANNLQTALDLPVPGNGAPLGSRLAPTSDGFVIWLPSTVQPVTLPEFGFRYGLQISQLFGTDFGFGWLRSQCGIDFVRV